MRVGALDIGSNSIKITVYKQKGTKLKEIGRKSITAGLLSGIREGKLTEDGYRILKQSLSELVGYAAKQDCGQVYPFATASLRAASNAHEVIGRIRDELGLSIDLIPGEREAELTFCSFRQSYPDFNRGILLDMGGGSTEVIGFADHTIVRRVSLPFGALSLHNGFVKNILPTPEEADAIRKFVAETLESADFVGDFGPALYLNGGSGKCLVKLCEEGDFKLPFVLEKSLLSDVCEKILACDRAIKALLLRRIPERVHTVPAALVALLTIMEKMSADRLTVTDAGVREGYLLEKIQEVDHA